MTWKTSSKISFAVCLALSLAAYGVQVATLAQYGPSPEPQPQPQPQQPVPQAGTRTVKFASLDGAQETPPTTSTGFGAGVLEVDETTGKLRGFVVSAGLVGTTAAHIHLESRGTPGSIIVPLSGGTDPTENTGLWVVPDGQPPLTPDQITAFKDGRLYFNVHTQANPNGEIRGQLDKTGTAWLASLDGAQETPATTSKALGGGILAVDLTSGQTSGFVVSSGIEGTAAHVHQAARGTPGDIIVPLTGGPTLWVVPDGAAPLTVAQIAAFGLGNLYYNVHTAANPNGEIRGQLDKKGDVSLATLDGAQETPPVTTTAFGASIVAVDPLSDVPSGFIVASGIATGNAAHVHAAARGTPGDIIVPMVGAGDFWVIPDAATPISAAQQAAFLTGGLYVNVHTPTNPSGEIRGQLE
jgi:hypothetical protein